MRGVSSKGTTGPCPLPVLCFLPWDKNSCYIPGLYVTRWYLDAGMKWTRPASHGIPKTPKTVTPKSVFSLYKLTILGIYYRSGEPADPPIPFLEPPASSRPLPVYNFHLLQGRLDSTHAQCWIAIASLLTFQKTAVWKIVTPDDEADSLLQVQQSQHGSVTHSSWVWCGNAVSKPVHREV